jgi:uncharacterized protein (TIGR04255 family)
VNVKPIHGSNAVKVVAFALELKEHLTTGDFSVLQSCHDETTAYLPIIKAHNSVTFKIENDGSSPVANESGIAALTFTKPKEGTNETEIALHVRDSAIIFQCLNYSTWANVFNEASNVFKDIIGKLGADKLVGGVSLEYLDEFQVLETESNWKQELLNVDSKYLQSYIFDTNGLWHSHSGYLNGSILNKINLECVEVEQLTCVKLLTQHQDREPSAGSLQAHLDDEFSVFTSLHQINIDVLSEILSFEMKSLIGLGS